MNNWQSPEEQKWMSWEIRVFLSRQKSTTSHLSKQLGNHPAKPLVLHNTQWIFITSLTCFLPSSPALPGQLHPREQSNNTFSFSTSKSQRTKKDVDINGTGVLWYIFHVWEKIETQGESKQACIVSEESDIYKCVSASLVNVFFSRWQWRQMSHVLGQTITVRSKWLNNTSDAVADEGNVVSKQGEVKRRCPCVVRAKRSTAVHLKDTVNKTCLLFFVSPMEARWNKKAEKLTTKVSCMLSKTFGSADLVTLNKVYRFGLVWRCYRLQTLNRQNINFTTSSRDKGHKDNSSSAQGISLNILLLDTLIFELIHSGSISFFFSIENNIKIIGF